MVKVQDPVLLFEDGPMEDLIVSHLKAALNSSITIDFISGTMEAPEGMDASSGELIVLGMPKELGVSSHR